MLDEKEVSAVSSPSLEGGSSPQELPAERTYHETDVFGREEDHEVRCFASSAVLLYLILSPLIAQEYFFLVISIDNILPLPCYQWLASSILQEPSLPRSFVSTLY